MSLPKKEYHRRWSRLRDEITKNDIGAILAWGEPRGSLGLLSTRNDVGYLVEWPIRQPGTGSVLLVFSLANDPTLLVSGPNYAQRYAERKTGLTTVRQCDPSQFVNEAVRVLEETGNTDSTVGVTDIESLPTWFTRDLKATALEISDVTHIVDEIRAQKSPLQRDRLRTAAEVVDMMFEELELVTDVGTSSGEIMDRLETVARSAGAEFANVWISSGPLGGEIPEFERRDGSSSLETGDLVVCGIHAVVDNHWGHAIRPVSIGSPTARHRELFDVVDGARDVVLDKAVPGTEVSDLYTEVQDVYESAGYQGSFRSVHGLGVRYGGPPRFPQPGSGSTDTMGTLESGMVFELHPNVRDTEDDGFCAMGDAVLVTDNGAELLNEYPTDPIVV